MPLYIYNSLTRKKEVFKPVVEGRVHIYVCGPTVYDFSHIGHAKSYISFDVVVRYLRYLGYDVLYVQNITDVGHLLDDGDDRVLSRARRDKIEPMALVEHYTRAYFEAMDALNVLRPDISPRATGHIPEQIDLVQILLKKGFAYEVNGSIYFDISKWPTYGKLSGRKVDEQQMGARLEVNEEKKHPADFALWKKADPKHIMKWNSPWGPGYPGWHVECSAMSMKYLGETIDIHGGGMENQFPHHECEIAQSEAATGKTFVKYWMHHNMVLVDGVKMSKSLNNFISVQDALKKYSGEQLRFFILQTHYRGPVDFSDKAIVAAGQGLQRLLTTHRSLRMAISNAAPGDVDAKIESIINEFRARFESEMNDDFNAPAAIGHLFDFSREINKQLAGSLSKGSVEQLLATFELLAGDVLGLLPRESVETVEANPFIDLLIELRDELRKDKNWRLSDLLRDKLAELGVAVEDGHDLARWRFK